ncbi:hypothetical protein QCB45_10520 [Thiomicrorhabdus sp. ZW0627]|uniref:hypothetical protein n=1 Tax=Thiomicrorhabdus sp. ZW0627 TaxID=3039774 RepID=UPI002436A0EC|nr:hypothetical protein [Thiomicrorhabdus sp. ZW0627]MDG6774766.1 hypothetical protein [Thiomicrorhabdus sp. ZW0627]
MEPKNSWLAKLDLLVQKEVELGMVKAVSLLRLVFIVFMVVYLAACLFSISSKLLEFILAQGVLDFPSIKVLLTDALFTLIVLAIVKALFINNSFDYALTFLEIAFVVIIRKLILLDTVPEENWTLLILGGISTAFFILIIYIHNLKRIWKEKEAAKV